MSDPRGAVAVGYVHSNEVSHSWHLSFVGMVVNDLGGEGRIARGGPISMRCGTGGIEGARNKVVERFLEDNRAEWLLWIDTDMGYPPDAVDRLLEVADPEERPIVGGLCFAQREMYSDGAGGYRCAPASTIFDWVELPKGGTGFLGRTNYPVNSLVRCAGTGSAFILIHRSVFERMAEAYGPTWYNRVKNPTTPEVQTMGEDLSFCFRACALDIPIHVNTAVRITHHKQLWLGEQDFWDFAIAPPAKDPVAVIVPVLQRPESAERFMTSLRASTGMAKAYAICDPDDDDTIKAWEAAGAHVMFPNGMSSPGTFAEKVNKGYLFTDEPWLFLVGDDVQFHPGWLDHAQAIAGDQFHVVGTNDLGNPRVTSGEHATHLLVRRSYVDEIGASWDGPEIVAHEGYRHWYVDDEIVTAAKQRNVWAMALGSKVEHLHPNWGKGQVDEVYKLGEAAADKDRRLFLKRLRGNSRG